MSDFLTNNLKNKVEDIEIILTYAQSLDACIAGKAGKQIRLSCDESMAMTHSLRVLSDAIIVGSGTLLNDNPGLNARIPALPALEDQPTPIIIDPHFKCPLNAKVIENYQRGIGKAPILLTFEGTKSTPKLIELVKSGVRIFGALTSSDEGLRWDRSIFDKITNEFGFKRYMIEGGASVIRSLLSSRNVVDKLIVTVSPSLIGSDGVSIITDGDRPVLRHRASKQFGTDTVFICDVGEL